MSSTKSDRTKSAILLAAGRLFAAHGYDRTSVRDIAALASIDPAMVIRYFGSKDQLFTRVAEFDLALPDLRAIERSQIGETLVRHFLSIWDGDQGESGLPVLLRSAASNEIAAARLRALFIDQVMPAIARAGTKSSASRRAGLVASQLIGIAMCRYILKLPPVVEMSREAIVQMIGDTIQRYATGAE